MPRPKVNAPLNVFVNGRLVGGLKRNLLPDTEPIRRRLGATGADAYSMLSGALQFLPEDIDPGPAGKTEGKLISDDEVAHIAKKKYRLCRRWWMPWSRRLLLVMSAERALKTLFRRPGPALLFTSPEHIVPICRLRSSEIFAHSRPRHNARRPCKLGWQHRQR